MIALAMLIGGGGLILYGYHWIESTSGPRRADGLLIAGLGWALGIAGLVLAVVT